METVGFRLGNEEDYERVLSLKRNSFTRTFFESYKNELMDKDEYLRLLNSKNKDVSFELLDYLIVYENLTAHAIDEHEAPVSFPSLEAIYGNSSFVFQYLLHSDTIVLTLFKDGKYKSISSLLESTWRFTFRPSRVDRPISASISGSSYLDAGFLKCALTLRKTYGIQDLLLIGMDIFRLFEKSLCRDVEAKSCRILFNLKHPNLSTITLFADDFLVLTGKTKLLPEITRIASSNGTDILAKANYALEVWKACFGNKFIEDLQAKMFNESNISNEQEIVLWKSQSV